MSAPLASWVSVGVLAFAVIGCRSTREAALSGPVPVYEEPRHHLVFQNALVRVLDVEVPPGDTTQYHIHAHPTISVSIQEARSWAQTLGAPPDSIEAPAAVPAVLDNWDRALPYTHRVGNADTVSFHYIVSEWLGPSNLDCPPLPEIGTQRLVKEGKIARVYEVRLAPHTATDLHQHACPGLSVLGTTGTLSEEGAAAAAGGGVGAGRWEWRNAGHRHVLRNTGDTPLIVFEIDWR